MRVPDIHVERNKSHCWAFCDKCGPVTDMIPLEQVVSVEQEADAHQKSHLEDK